MAILHDWTPDIATGVKLLRSTTSRQSADMIDSCRKPHLNLSELSTLLLGDLGGVSP